MALDVTYVALRRLTVGGQTREEGDLVPEASTFHNLDAYLRTGRLTAVPRSSVDQDALSEAEHRVEALRTTNQSKSRREAPEEADEGVVDDLVEEHTSEELYEQAQDLDVEGRSSMDKEELAEAVAEEQVEAEANDDLIEQYHVGSGWYEVPGAEKKMRKDDALEFLTSPESDEE